MLLTQDLDFGELFVRGQLPALQVVLVRTRGGRPDALNGALASFLKAIDLDDLNLPLGLIVVTERGYRIRRLP